MSKKKAKQSKPASPTAKVGTGRGTAENSKSHAGALPSRADSKARAFIIKAAKEALEDQQLTADLVKQVSERRGIFGISTSTG